jgi:7-cyano-7-deazaguanine synthase
MLRDKGLKNMQKKAVVLLSGGLDSAVTLYMARQKDYDCHCLIFDYSQRHKKEIKQAEKIAKASGSKFETVKLIFPWKGSSLVDKKSNLPLDRTVNQIKEGSIPSTYVPGRNTIFLSIASSFAEVIGASAIFIGAHYEDSSGYPDCRSKYLEAFDKVLRLGTKAGIEGKLKLEFPLIKKSKAQIIKTGVSLKVPFNLTWSCYSGGAKPCMRCDSCILRANGFSEAGVSDPLTNNIVTPKATITEVFSSIQGEGTFAGVRQIFVRFKKCNMKCDFCDTPNKETGEIFSPAQLVRQIRSLDKKNGVHHSVSLTGGEPLMYTEFLKKLLPSLKEAGFKIYLETNGTLPDKLRQIIGLVDIVAMDFKLPSATKDEAYWEEHLEFLKIASTKKVLVKAVVSADTEKSDIEQAIILIKKVDVKIPFIIQPATVVKTTDKVIPENKLREFFNTALKNDIKNSRIIPQTHKILGVK